MNKGCEDPILLPEKGLSPYETETGWAADRKALVYCKSLQKITANPLNQLNQDFTNAPKPRERPLFRE